MPCKCVLCGYEKKGLTSDFTKWPEIPGFNTEFYPVTKNGKPDGEVLGLICARCLNHADSMRVYVKAMMSGVQVTRHAVIRFIERSGSAIPDEQTGRVAVIKAFSKSRRIRFRTEFMVTRLINNDFQDVDYYWVSDLVFVVTRLKPRTIVTVEKLWGKGLNKDFFLVEE
ncbi:MAG TPA: hypothetical protein DET40_04915 [Lentisphaeria bacterium]|nr:MAG: hypothetical protein A2X45_13490 [Lentisphaerae bacterium GWF2_50_93]HCE42867.1 hypothetical protein [Lentisphaeria bacterium]